MQIPFTKMHGLGNDFIVIDGVSQSIQLDAAQIKQLGDRRFGIGFDQLLLVEPASEENIDFSYRIFNVDGSEVEHCGNGARCFARFVHDKGLSDKNPLLVQTVNRTLRLDVDAEGNVSVDMGEPEFAPEQIPLLAPQQADIYQRTVQVAGEEMTISFSALSMGNPHAVIEVEDLAATAVKDIGEALGAHPDFPEGVNVGFMQVLNSGEIKLRVFERGTGETLACGTGACAAVVAGQTRGLLDEEVSVRLAGGYLRIHWQGQGSSVLMTGPATTVYQGSVEI
jgi:diaminopimelate epimerase